MTTTSTHHTQPSFPAPRMRLVPATLVGTIALLGLLAGERTHAAPVALITDVLGDAQLGGEALKLLAEIEAGRELALAQGTTVVVFYLGDGSEWTLHGPGRYRLGARAPEAQSGAAAAQRRPGPPAYREIKLRAGRLQQGGLVFRGEEPMALIAPTRSEVVLSSDVRFDWKALETGTGYQFELVDQAGTKLLAAGTTDNGLQLPLAIQLQPGQTYYWSVRGRAPNSSRQIYRVAEFRVADAPTRRRIDAARPKGDAPFSERALFVVLLEDLGARTAAAHQRMNLAPERPVGWSVDR